MKVIQVVGYKNSGKTSLVVELVRLWSSQGKKVGTVKRDAHDADPEPEGADTRRHREAGAHLTALTSVSRTLWVRGEPSSLDGLLDGMRAEGADIAIVEGFKTEPHPKIVLLRGEQDADLLALSGILCVGVRGDGPMSDGALEKYGKPAFRTEGFRFGPLLAFVEGRMT